MRSRWLKILAAGLLVLVVVLLSAGFTIMRTETGAGWVLSIAQDRLEGLEIGSHSGSIHDGLELRNVGYDTPEFLLLTESLGVTLRTDWLPFVLRVEWLEFENLVFQVRDTAGESDSGGIPDSLEPPFTVELTDIRFSGITLLDGQGVSMFEVTSLQAAASVDSQVSLHVLELVLEQGEVAAEGQVALKKPFPLDVRLEADLGLPIEDRPEPLLLGLGVKARGSIDGLELGIEGTAEPPGFGAHSFAAESRVTPTGMETALFEISGPDLRARGSSAIDWDESSVRLEDVRLEIPDTEIEVQANLAVDLESEEIEGWIAWNDMTWPLRGESAEWTSRQGSVRLSGMLDNWAVEGQVDLEASGYPGGQLQFEAVGDRGGVEARIHEAQVLGGRFNGSGAYRWDDGGAFTAELGLENLDTASLAPEYPAVLSGDLAASGRVDPLTVSLNVRRIHGMAMGMPVIANGRVEVDEGSFRAEDFSIESGTSRLLLDGFPDEENGLSFSTIIADLGDFLPDGRGELSAGGTLFLRSDWPVLNLEAQGNDIGWKDFRVSSLAVNRGQGSPSVANVFDVSLLETRMGDTVFDEVDARLSLNADSQAIQIAGRSGTRQVSAELEGVLEHWADSPDAWNWTGKLGSLDIVLSEQNSIRLREPATVLASPNRLEMGPGCLAGSRGATTCTEAAWSASDGSEFSVRIEQWPLDVVGELLGLDIRLSHQASGAVQLSFPPSDKPSGSADFRVSAGAVGYVDDPDPVLETGEGALAFTLVDGRLTSGVVDVPITGQGVIDVDYDITDVTMGLDSEVRGRLLVDLADLDVLSAVMPKADRLSGTLRAELDVSGILGQPDFNGRLDLRDGLVENRGIGLKLENIELSGQLAENRETRLTGSFRAAEGKGKLEALVDLRDIQQPRFQLGVSGEQLKLFNSDDLMVVVDPDISVDLQPGSVTIDGSIHIPSALVAPAVIPEQTVAESPDLVFVAGRPASDEAEQKQPQPVSLQGELGLSLGDDVKLDLTVAEFDVTGSVGFNWQGAALPTANGSFNLGGEILAFGQLLEIAQADIRFPNVPADNPHLNIRAEREIYGNSEVRRAGLLIAGTVRRPVVEPYTDPLTNRDRAQTLLVTGSDFNMERGVGAVDIGTYIAPRIFVSYGVGVFDDQNVLSIRYDLGRGWGVKATSGERQTGVDISYTVEN